VKGNENNGYCTHVSNLFPPWHRPYLALYEVCILIYKGTYTLANSQQQVLYDLVQQIAQQYPAGPTRNKYAAAAANFRIPYWDWAAIPAAGQSVFPESVGGSPSVSVDGPAGTQTIANPLYSYQFKPLDPTQLPDFPVGYFYSARIFH